MNANAKKSYIDQLADDAGVTIRRVGRGRPRRPPATCMHAEGAAHCCAYVEWRDSLVPLAEKRAGEVCGAEPDGNREVVRRWSLRWDAEFHREMKRLSEDPFARASMAMMATTHTGEVH